MIVSIAILALFLVIVLFIWDSSKSPVLTSRLSSYFSPFFAETIVKHEYTAGADSIWKALTSLSSYNTWFPGVLRLLPVVETNRYVHRYSFDQFTLKPGAFILLQPFSFSPAFRGRVMAVEKNRQLTFEMKFNPFHKELVTFELEPGADSTEVTCLRRSKGLFSFMTVWGFSGSKSRILDNLGYFIPEEKQETTEESPLTAEKFPTLSREATIARAVQAGLEGNSELIDAITDKPTRGMAKATLVQTQRKGGVLPENLRKALLEEPSTTPIKPAVPATPPVAGTLPEFANTDDLIAFVVNKALDGDDEPVKSITDKPTRGKAKAMLVKIKRGTLERPPLPEVYSVVTAEEAPEAEAAPAGESEEGLIKRLVETGIQGNMEEINALDSRVLRGTIKAAIIKAKRAAS